MKKHLLITTLVFALVLCFSFGALGADITNPNADDDNQYKITQALQDYAATSDLFIGTLDKWKAAGGAVGDTGTFFQNGEAINGNDIIITNGKAGIVLAVGTRNPWGYPAGSVLDAGTVSLTGNDITKATAKRDTAWSIEFLVHGWDGWAPSNCGTVTFDLVKYDFATKAESATGLDAVKVSRVYTVNGADLDIVTYYGIAAGAETAYMFDSITNNDSKITLKNRFALTNKGDDGGSMYGNAANKVIGCYGNVEGKPYNISYTVPGANTSSASVNHPITAIGGSLGYKELRAHQEYAAGESVTFDEYIVLNDSPDMDSFTDFKTAYDKVTTYAVSGTVKDSADKVVSEPVVVVENANGIYGWYTGEADGTYSIKLPAGTYSIFVERDGYAPGTAQEVVVGDVAVTQNLVSGAAKVKVTFNIKDQDGNALWGKVDLYKADGSSAYPSVRYTGESIYQATEKGVIEAYVAPGNYTAVVYGEGYWFYSEPKSVTGNTETASVDVTITKPYSLADGWLSGDLHHHANKNDAFADPSDAIPSMLASGLDVAFITDHDFTVNNAEGYALAQKYGMAGFIPSEEISCSWAHFNVIPQTKEAFSYFLDTNKENKVMNQFGKLQEFVDQTHNTGAIITANHPWYSYGLFYAYDAEAIPGGYTDDYDTIEINACNSEAETADTINSATELWSSYLYKDSLYTDIDGKDVVTEKAHYLVGGSDTHDVLISGFAGSDYQNIRGAGQYATGKARTMAYVGETTDSVLDNGLAFANAVADGNSYVSFGPLYESEKLPGETYTVSEFFNLKFTAKSVADIKDILILSNWGNETYTLNGKTIDNVYTSWTDINNEVTTETFADDVYEGETGWYSVVIVDVNGNFSITNPYWYKQTNRVFNDTAHWGLDAINYLSDLGIVNGYTDGSFNPDADITRAEFAKMMAEIAPEIDEPKTISFSDVTKGEWYYDSVMYMAQDGYINGYPDGSFRPNAKITREEIAQIIYKVSGLTATKDAGFFSDVTSANWSMEAINTLAANKLVKGYSDGTFRPAGYATRAEGATFIYNYIKHIITLYS